jgi:hypothetical protein
VSCEAALGLVWIDFAYSPRAPLRRLSATARVSDAVVSFRLVARARRLAFRLTGPRTAGCVRPSSASHHSVDRHPRPVGFRSRDRRARIFHDTLLASAGRAPCCDAGLCLPRAEAHDRTSDTPRCPQALTQRHALLLRRSVALPEDPDRLLHDPRDGTAAPSIRSAFPRQVSGPSARSRLRHRGSIRAFRVLRSGFACLEPLLDASSLATILASRFRDRRRPTAR